MSRYWQLVVIYLYAAIAVSASADMLYFRMRHFGTSQGLPHSTVVALEEDHLGFLWIGTPNGLARFDGTRLHSYLPQKHSQLPHPRITALLSDSQQRLWVGTRDGIAQYDYVTDSFRRVQVDDITSSQPLSVYRLLEDSDNQIIAATNQGLFVYSADADAFHRHPVSHPWLTHPIRSALAAPNGSLLLGVPGKGLVQIQSNQAKILVSENTTTLPEIRALAVTDDRTIWIGTRDGLFRLPRDGQLSRVMLTQSEHPLITQLLVDSFGRLWVGSYVQGGWLIEANGRQHHLFPSPLFHQSLRDKQIFALTQTSDGGLWFGTYAGLFYLPTEAKDMPYRLLSKPKDLVEKAQWVSWIEVDREDLWVTQLRKGLWRIKRDTGEKTFVPTPHALPYVIHKAPQGGLWVGFDGGGLYHYSPLANRFTKFGQEKGLEAKWVTRIFVDQSGISWIGTNNGLYRYDREMGRFQQVSLLSDTKERPFILAINADDSNHLWVGTTVHGLFRLDLATGQILNFRHQTDDEKSLLHNLIYDIHIDGDSIFIASRAGLSKLNVRDFSLQHLTRENGLPDATVFAIRGRADKLMWIGTEQGIALVDQSLNILKVLNTANGLFDAPRAYGAFAADADGLWLGYNGGLSFVPNPPGQVLSLEKVAPPIVEQIFIDDRLEHGHYLSTETQASLFTIRVPSTHQSVRFVLSTPVLSRLGQGDVLYRLAGLNKKWTRLADPGLTISYTNLPAGTYTLELRARLGARYSPVYRPVMLYVTSPPLLSPLALTLYVVIGLIALLLWRQKHVRQLREAEALQARLEAVDRAKDELLANVSHELRTPLNGIMGMAQLLRDGLLGQVSDDIKTAVNEIFNAGLRLNLLVGNLISLSQLKAGNFAIRYEKFAPRPIVEQVIRLLQNERSTKRHLDIRIHIDPDLTLYADKQIFELVMTNLIQNAFKFTEEGFVEIRIEQVDDQWMISVADSGIGMSQEMQGAVLKPFQQRDSSLTRLHGGLGLGLSICQQLLALVDSHLWINSREGEGSIFSFYLPINPKPKN
ncbi:MAG: hypothetical protein D6694_02485 [Gammaproteobacteria bacterium]|nr:MAG: hypothetical protein D6694_02485 [Gammaproteobacteria bacterium]